MDEKQKQWEGDLFRLLVENVRDYAIFIIDPQGGVMTWSKGGERLLGYTEAEVIGQHFRLFFTPEDAQKGEPEREIAQARTTGRGEDDRWHVRKDGSRLWISGVLTRLDQDGGEVRGFAKIMRDLTAQKRMEDTLRKRTGELATANAHKDRFMAVLSHELRNPLAPIRNVATIIGQQTADNPILQHATMILDRQVRQMTRLVEDLLDAARIATGKVKLNKELVEACVIVQRAVETTRPLIEERKHHLTVTLPKEPMWLHADPARLEQIVVNLLNNAAKYTEEGGRISVAAEREEGKAAVRVRDTGIGISPKMLPHVFDLFTQDETTLHRKQGGIGVGLGVARSLVEMHGGTIEARSEGEGKGSEFVVRLPLLAGRPTERLKSRESVKLPSQSLRVLVVDDNTDSADSLATLLQLSGHEVRAEYSGAAALQMAATYQPEVVLCDIGMPVMDGLEVARRLRQRLDMSKVVLVAMTGYGQETDRQQTQEAGFAYHMVKPVDFQQLHDLLAVLADDHGNGGN
jgi:PAS domain S-box-containing protein